LATFFFGRCLEPAHMLLPAQPSYLVHYFVTNHQSLFDVRCFIGASECPDVKNYKWWLNLVWHSCTHMASVGVKGLAHVSVISLSLELKKQLLWTADYKDFASKYTTSGGEKRSSKNPEGVAELMDRIRVWLDESSTAVINIQTVDHHAYYRSAIDAPGLLHCLLTHLLISGWPPTWKTWKSI